MSTKTVDNAASNSVQTNLTYISLSRLELSHTEHDADR